MTARKSIMLGTAGHVDHGKTALVRLLTGCNTDTLAEEQQRGLTIDLGFAPCRLSDQRVVGVIDVPGHVDFIRNMVAGAHGIDVVIFVVAADDGVMPQTREHLNILTLMGLRHGVVALTKIDLVEPALRDAAADNVRRLLAGTFLEPAPICPLSTVTGEGYDAFYDALNVAVDRCAPRDCTGLFRAWVADVLSIRGFGTVLTGIPSSGTVRVGDQLRLLPTAGRGHVRRLEVYGEDAAEGRTGECVAINLPELEHTQARRGMVLAESDALAPVSMVEGELGLLDSVRGRLKDYAEVHLHLGTMSTLARVALLETAELTAGQRQMVQFRLTESFGIVPGDRYVIRAAMSGAGEAGLMTIGGGRVLRAANVRLRRQRPWIIAALAARREALDDSSRWQELLLRESQSPLAMHELARRSLGKPEETARVLASLQARGLAIATLQGAWVHRDTVVQVAAQILAAIETFHAAHPQRLGLEPSALTASLPADPQVVELAIGSLLADERITHGPGGLAKSGWTVTLASAEDRLAEQIATGFATAGWTAPTADELSLSLGQPLPRVERLLILLAERGALVKLPGGGFMHRTAVESGRRVALGLFGKAPSFSTMAFRDALGVSRKYAVPLLDYLDGIRFTVRNGHTRTPGVEARKLMP